MNAVVEAQPPLDRMNLASNGWLSERIVLCRYRTAVCYLTNSRDIADRKSSQNEKNLNVCSAKGASLARLGAAPPSYRPSYFIAA